MIREGLFSLEQRTKACFMSFRVSLTPATILRHAMLENAKTFSVHETGFEHKIYGWLCFCQYERSGKWGRIKFTTAEHRCHYIFPSSGWFVVGRIKKEFKIVVFLSVIGNRDV